MSAHGDEKAAAGGGSSSLAGDGRRHIAPHDHACYNGLSAASKSMGISLAVGQRTLDPWAQVRILDPQLFSCLPM